MARLIRYVSGMLRNGLWPKGEKHGYGSPFGSLFSAQTYGNGLAGNALVNRIIREAIIHPIGIVFKTRAEK